MPADQNGVQLKATKIKEIYTKASEKLASLKQQQKEIIKNYIKELENRKIASIHKKLGL